MTKIGLGLLLGGNVIFVTENLSAEAVSELKTVVDSAGLGGRVLFWPAGVGPAGGCAGMRVATRLASMAAPGRIR